MFFKTTAITLWATALLSVATLLPQVNQAMVCQVLFKSSHRYLIKEQGSASWADDVYEYNTIYLNFEQRQRLLIHIGKDGKFYDSENVLLNIPNGAMYVMSPNGEIYVHQEHLRPVGRFQHSSFLAGGPIAGAGLIVIKDGIVTKIDNGSGHYSPPLAFLLQVLQQLQSDGAKLSQLSLTNYQNKTIRIDDIQKLSDKEVQELDDWNRRALFELLHSKPAPERLAVIRATIEKNNLADLKILVSALSKKSEGDWREIIPLFFSSRRSHVIVAAAELVPKIIEHGFFYLIEPILKKWLVNPTHPNRKAAALGLLSSRRQQLSIEEWDWIHRQSELMPKDADIIKSLAYALKRLPANERKSRAQDLVTKLELLMHSKTDGNYFAEIWALRTTLSIFSDLPFDRKILERLKTMAIFIRDFKPQNNDAPWEAGRILQTLEVLQLQD